jgi:negative regulator of flagellin synthesis FlgM
METPMTDAINTNNRLKVSNQPVDNKAKSATAGNSRSSAASASASAVVELSSDQILQQMQKLPEVDSAKIESIKAAIANGDYKPNAEMIAKKFSEIEQLLP